MSRKNVDKFSMFDYNSTELDSRLVNIISDAYDIANTLRQNQHVLEDWEELSKVFDRAAVCFIDVQRELLERVSGEYKKNAELEDECCDDDETDNNNIDTTFRWTVGGQDMGTITVPGDTLFTSDTNTSCDTSEDTDCCDDENADNPVATVKVMHNGQVLKEFKCYQSDLEDLQIDLITKSPGCETKKHY